MKGKCAKMNLDVDLLDRAGNYNWKRVRANRFVSDYQCISRNLRILEILKIPDIVGIFKLDNTSEILGMVKIQKSKSDNSHPALRRFQGIPRASRHP